MPLASQLRAVDVPLSNLTIATLQEQSEFLSAHFQTVPVANRSGKYYVYPVGEYNRPQMQPRGPSTESEGGNWTLSTDTYSCINEAVHYDQDWDDLADADPQVNPDQDAADFLANQAGMRLDQKITALFANSIWSTDWDGHASTESGTNFIQFDQSASDPQVTAERVHTAVRTLTGKRCNTFIAGLSVHRELVTNPIVRDAVKYTARTSLDELYGALAGFLGVEKYIPAGNFSNTAQQGQTASLSPILSAVDAWMGYVAPLPGMKTLSAFNVLGFNGGGKSGKSNGMSVSSFDIPPKKCTRHELSLDVDVKVISADCGAFLDAAVSA